MESNNSVQNLIQILKSLIIDLDDQKECLINRKDELENVSRLLAYTKDKIEMIGVYANQELIISCFDKIGCTNDEYKASCYLLNTEEDSVRKLPQYARAHDLMERIIEFFRFRKAELLVEINELSESCKRKELEKKYYDILTSSQPFVEDANEFEEILNSYDLTEEDKINILTKIINDNIKYYELKNK